MTPHFYRFPPPDTALPGVLNGRPPHTPAYRLSGALRARAVTLCGAVLIALDVAALYLIASFIADMLE
jgi:hypothetical protein